MVAISQGYLYLCSYIPGIPLFIVAISRVSLYLLKKDVRVLTAIGYRI
jgi:hypothetical protein